MKFKMKTDRIVAFSAMFISLLTLIIFIYQTSLIREQSRLGVMPRLEFNQITSMTDTTVTFTLELENSGLGPAILDSLVVSHENKNYRAEYSSFFKNQLPELLELGSLEFTSFLQRGSTIKEDESVILIRYRLSADDYPKFKELIGNNNNFGDVFNITIIYSSLYLEKWKVNLQTDDSTPVSVS